MGRRSEGRGEEVRGGEEDGCGVGRMGEGWGEGWVWGEEER